MRWLILLLLVVVYSTGDAITLLAVPTPTTSPGGLCVVVGRMPVQELAALHQDGRMLVDCLVPEARDVEPMRVAIATLGLNGLVTVRHLPPGRPLPYVDGLVNLLISDNSVDPSEVARVVAPFGTTRIAGKTTTVPLPATMGEWPQSNADAAQSNWSPDTLAGPPTGFRWISPMIDVAVPGGKSPLRTSGGRVFSFIFDAKGRTQLEARNAFNGTALWSIPAQYEQTVHNNDTLIANPNHVYAYLATHEYMSCIDARTGTILWTLENGTRWEKQGPKPRGGAERKTWEEYNTAMKTSVAFAQTIQDGSRVVVLRDSHVGVFDDNTGKKLWAVDLPGVKRLKGAIGQGRLYVVSHLEGMDLGGHRGTEGGIGVGRALAFDLATGREVWRTEQADIMGDGIGMLYMAPHFHKDRIVLAAKLVSYPNSKKGSGNSTLPPGWRFIALDAATGKVKWRESDTESGGKIDRGTIWVSGSLVDQRTGEFWIGSFNRAIGIDTATGKQIANRPVGGRPCFWCRGIGDWFAAGPFWVHLRTGETAAFGTLRPDCNDTVYGVYGGVMSSNSNCECHKFIQGRVMMTSGPVPKTTPDNERLEIFTPLAPTPEVAGGWPSLMADGQRSGRAIGKIPQSPKSTWSADLTIKLPAGPIAQDWANDPTIRLLSPAVVAGDTVVVAQGHQHTLIALSATTGDVLWRTVLGGRIDSPPTLWRGHAYAGCRDGYVYAVNLKDGRIAWRHLVANDRRMMVNASQLESLWPVLGTTVIHNGKLYAAGGITSQHDGGIWVACIDPLAGQSRWRARTLSPGSFQNSVRLEPPVVIGNKIWMDKMAFDLETGEGGDAAAKILRDAEASAGHKPKKPNPLPVYPDDRIALATSGDSAWFGWPLRDQILFPGFSGMQMTMMMPGARTNHRGGSVGHWATDDNGHYRVGFGEYQRKFGDGRIDTLSAWKADDPKAGFKGKDATEPLWKVATGHGVAVAMDAEAILLIESGSGTSGTLYLNPGTPQMNIFKRSDGTSLTPGGIKLPSPVTWRGVAVGNGAIYLSLEDAKLVCWR